MNERRHSLQQMIYYGGSEGRWGDISIDSDNTSLTNAAIHYNSTGN